MSNEDDIEDRLEVDILGRNLGTASGWDGEPGESVWFYDFRPRDGIALKCCDLLIDFTGGYIGSTTPDGEMESDNMDIISFLQSVPRL